MENKEDTTGIIGIIGTVLRLYRDNGKEIGNCYLGLRV